MSDRTPAQGEPDAEWVRDACRGDRAAFGLLYRRYRPMVHGILLARVASSDVDDLVQDVFLRAYERLATLRDVRSCGAWLSVLARNRANDHFRRARDTTELPEDLAVHDRDMVETEEVLEMIRSLPGAYRETLILRLVEGMTGPEIAARTGLTAASVRVNLHRGMKQLREKLSRTEIHE